MNENDDFFASFGDDVARMRRAVRPSLTARVGFGLWFGFCALVGLGALAVFVWAIITLVTWVVA